MEIALKTKLYRIHLSSGKYDTIKNTDDETILGVEGRNIILKVISIKKIHRNI